MATGDGAAPLEKPRPRPTPVSEPFWDGLRAGQVRVQHCADCGAWVHYPRWHCPQCLSERLSWEEVAARGTIYAMTVARQATAEVFADEVPQLIAVVELEQGTRLTTTIVADRPELLKVGTPVSAVFDRDGEGPPLLRFTPTRDAPG